MVVIFFANCFTFGWFIMRGTYGYCWITVLQARCYSCHQTKQQWN